MKVRVRWNRLAGLVLGAAALVGFALMIGGCGPAREDRELLTIAAGVAGGDVGDWEDLTDEQRLRAHYKLARALYVLDANVNGHSIPPVFIPREPSREILVKAQR